LLFDCGDFKGKFDVLDLVLIQGFSEGMISSFLVSADVRSFTRFSQFLNILGVDISCDLNRLVNFNFLVLLSNNWNFHVLLNRNFGSGFNNLVNVDFLDLFVENWFLNSSGQFNHLVNFRVDSVFNHGFHDNIDWDYCFLNSLNFNQLFEWDLNFNIFVDINLSVDWHFDFSSDSGLNRDHDFINNFNGFFLNSNIRLGKFNLV